MVKKNPKDKQTHGEEKGDSPAVSTPRKSDRLRTKTNRFKSTTKKRAGRGRSEEEDYEVVSENNMNTSKKRGASYRYQQEEDSDQSASGRMEEEGNPGEKREEKIQQEYPIPSITEQGIPLHYYTGRTSYRLDTFNSITIQQGQIYNLLEDPFLKERQKKETKCNCSQSRCKAKYCICYSKGKRCGLECGCVNCANLVEPIREGNQQITRSCKCQKSHCLKNYCECRRDGEFCSPECKCKSCLNTKPAEKEGGEENERVVEGEQIVMKTEL